MALKDGKYLPDHILECIESLKSVLQGIEEQR
ncbi:hypothetical protein SRABI112_04312 [Pseudomonas mediterranea]|nr:hypothetical protein SRABI112_04312 [Pseudomonas mediterranea]